MPELMKRPIANTASCPTPGEKTMSGIEWSLLTALVELTDSILCAETREATLRTLAFGLKSSLECDYVALATRHGSRFRIEVFTHLDSFDTATDVVRALETACAAAFRNEESAVTSVTPAGGDSITCIPFVSAEKQVVAVALLRIAESSPSLANRNALTILGDHLSPALETKLAALKRTDLRSRWMGFVGKLGERKRLLQVGVLVASATAMLPFPYRVRCDAELQPVVRRHIAAPFDGIFQQSMVKPGDVVAVGQTLVRLDPKELTWEIAAATADRDRAAKSRAANLATGKTAQAQIDALESKRLAERLKLLENRLAHLEVTTPIAGIIVSGNLERAEGAPVKIGQSLFEVAPLDRMIVEVLVPEAEIDRISTGHEIQLYLDAVPNDGLSGLVSRVHPRAELRNGANVFIAEVELSNGAGLLRPGMKGTVDVRTERRPLAWIAAHRIGEMFWRFVR